MCVCAHRERGAEEERIRKENTTILILLKEGKKLENWRGAFLVEICGMLIGKQELGRKFSWNQNNDHFITSGGPPTLSYPLLVTFPSMEILHLGSQPKTLDARTIILILYSFAQIAVSYNCRAVELGVVPFQGMEIYEPYQ